MGRLRVRPSCCGGLDKAFPAGLEVRPEVSRVTCSRAEAMHRQLKTSMYPSSTYLTLNEVPICR